MTYYCRRNDKDGRLECEVVFAHIELRTYRRGPEAYLFNICKEPDYELDRAGAIRPFEYSCAKVGIGEIYMLTVGEMG